MMRIDTAAVQPHEPAPPVCPFCRAAHVTTTSKTVSDATYGRCHGCGQVWNPARLVLRPPRQRW